MVLRVLTIRPIMERIKIFCTFL